MPVASDCSRQQCWLWRFLQNFDKIHNRVKDLCYFTTSKSLASGLASFESDLWYNTCCQEHMTETSYLRLPLPLLFIHPAILPMDPHPCCTQGLGSSTSKAYPVTCFLHWLHLSKFLELHRIVPSDWETCSTCEPMTGISYSNHSICLHKLTSLQSFQVVMHHL